MCTSFVWRKDGDVIVAMNFDNDGKPFALAAKPGKQFVVSVDGAPSFGVNIDGTFVNHLAVDSDGSGAYRRGKNVLHTIRFITDLLNNKLAPQELDEFLAQKEIVNVPKNNCHCLVTDVTGNAWLIEPGRGSLASPVSQSPYFLMTNYPLIDATPAECATGSGADRSARANDLLKKSTDLDVSGAFEILSAAKQDNDEWRTAFSMVYHQKENAVYYCYDGDFAKIQKFEFQRSKL